MLLNHGITPEMKGLDSYDQGMKSLSTTTIELNANAYGQDELDDMLRASTPTRKSTLTLMARGHAHSNKLKLNGALNHGSVKKKGNPNSKKRPAHWRKMALRKMFAGVSLRHQCTSDGPVCSLYTCHFYVHVAVGSYTTVDVLLLVGSQGLRGILRGKGNPIESMNERDVKPFLQQALTTPGGWKVVDLEDPEVPNARITEGDRVVAIGCHKISILVTICNATSVSTPSLPTFSAFIQ